MGAFVTAREALSAAERVCPICDGASYSPFADERVDPAMMSDFTYSSRKTPEFMRLRLVRCSSCDLVYAPNPPAKDFLEQAYGHALFDSGAEAHAAAQTYSKYLETEIRRLKHRKMAIDVGAGSGSLIPFLRGLGFKIVWGIEPSRAAIEAGHPSVKPHLIEGMFSEETISGFKPSLVCSFMTLEHIDNPGQFARTVFEALEPGGMLAVVAHNWRAPFNRFLGLRSPIIDVEHLQLFSPSALKQMLTQSGYELVSIKSITNKYPLRYWIRLTPLPIFLKNWAIHCLDVLRLGGALVPMRVGNMFAVGFKPEDSNGP